MKKTINQRELARLVAQRTGYTIADVEEVLKAESEVITSAIEQGVEVKNHKLFKIEIETKKPKKAWNGFAKEYYEIPEKKVVKIKPLSMISKAVDKLNEENEQG